VTKPTIDEIAALTPHILHEFGDRNRAMSGSVDFYKDDIDVKGDGTLWAMVEYEVDYDWTHEPGDRETPPVSDFDVVDVRVKGASFNTGDGDEVEIDPSQASRALVDYFWANNLDTDDVLADQIHERSESGSLDEPSPTAPMMFGMRR